tara:strand:- start:569 stop:1006 length:438 start_codon:yes stop_codon:yes gene_type:complete
MSNKKLTYGDIWKKLRAVDTKSIQYKKSNLDYIGWADAWATLMDNYSEAAYEFPNPTFYGTQEKSTCEVHCKIIIGDLSREFSLPVMTSMLPMKSIENPTSRDINDAKARCLVKVLGMFGLGLHLWEKKSLTPSPVVKHGEGIGF